MRRSAMLSLVCLLSACQVPLSSLGDRRPRQPVVARKVEPSATPTPTPEPEAEEVVATRTVTPAPTATPAATPTPAAPVTVLSGLIRVDASYIVSTGGGKIIATGGGNIIATGGGNIISTGGGNIIATGGGNIIATGGGNIISTGGGNYRTLQADSDMLPIQGMVVVPVSLLTREQIAPAVKTDDQGRYRLAIPDAIWKDPSQKENIRIYAAVPAKDENDPILNDPKLSYEQIVAPEATASPTLDEDVNQATRYIFQIYGAHLSAMLQDQNTLALDTLDDTMRITFMQLIADVRQARLDAGLLGSDVPGLADRIAGYVLSRQNLQDMKIEPIYVSTDNPGTREALGRQALEVMIEFMTELRSKTTAKLKAGPIDTKSADFPPAPGHNHVHYTIVRGSDMCDYVAKEYLSKENAIYHQVLPTLEYVGMDLTDRQRMSAAGSVLWIKVGLFLLQHKAEVLEVIRRYGEEKQNG